MPPYTCNKCGKIFDQKSHFEAHQAKKNPCDKNNVILNTLIEEKLKSATIKIDVSEYTVTNKPRSIMADIIHNKEQRSAFYEGLHNLLWNEAGFDPAKALEHLTFFFAFRMIEDQVDTLELPQVCRWSYVVNLHDEHQIDAAVKKAILAFGQNEITKPFFKRHEIKKADLVQRIMNEINRLDFKSLQETDTLGDLFEYMIGRGMKTMADEGQYFTDRVICRLAFELCHQIKGTVFRADGGICTFADFFCGTGGFVTEYIKGVNKVAREVGKSVDWSVAKDRVYAVDKSESAAKTTLLNQLIITGKPFNSNNIREHNSFADPLVMGATAPFKDVKMDYLLLNPPYGGDKTKGKDYKFKYTRIVEEGGVKKKQFCVNPEIQSIGIEDDDKVSAGVQLAMATLTKEGGVCAIVLPQGFFFGAAKKCVELRKKIAEEYKIHYVVDIASGAFANTGTKTSMMVFQRGVGPTDTIVFCGPDKKPIVDANLEQLRSKNYSLNYKQYMSQDTADVEGFEMVKLGDVCDIQFGERITKKEHIGIIYPVYGGGNDTFRTDKKNREGITCKISRFGISVHNCVQIITGDYWLMDSGFTITAKKDKAISSYLWNWLLQNKSTVYKCGRATAQMNMDMASFNDIQIPLPSLERQAEIVRAIDTWADFARREEEMLKILEHQVMFEVREMGRGKPRVKLGEVCEIESGTYITKKTATEGNYPVYGGGDVSFHITEFNRESKFIISKDGVSETCVRYVPGKFYLNHHGWTFKEKSNILYSYLGYWLLNNQHSLYELATGTAQKGINQISFYGLEIPLPPLIEQQTLQSDFDEIKHKHAKIAEYKKKANDAVQRLIPGAAKTSDSEQFTSAIVPVNEIVNNEPKPKPVVHNETDYKSKTLVQLKGIAREKGIKGFSTKKKDELITLLGK
jgi:type I restriction-modification system DNA methylase subunit/restriction endonuclease S subunit